MHSATYSSQSQVLCVCALSRSDSRDTPGALPDDAPALGQIFPLSVSACAVLHVGSPAIRPCGLGPSRVALLGLAILGRHVGTAAKADQTGPRGPPNGPPALPAASTIHGATKPGRTAAKTRSEACEGHRTAIPTTPVPDAESASPAASAARSARRASSAFGERANGSLARDICGL
jgi:hypothetical protein